jgi:hypothetical protein
MSSSTLSSSPTPSAPPSIIEPVAGVSEPQSQCPAYYMFPGTDVTEGSAKDENMLELHPGHTWGGLVSEGAIHLVPFHTPGDRRSVPARFDRNGQTVISFIHSEFLRPMDERTTDTAVPPNSQRYVVTQAFRMWAKSEQGNPSGGVFVIYCRSTNDPTVLPGVDCLYPAPSQRRLIPSLQLETSGNGSHYFDAGGRGLFHLDIASGPTTSPTRTSNDGTLSHTVASLESLAERLILGSTSTTSGRETSPNDEGDDIDELVGSYSQGR